MANGILKVGQITNSAGSGNITIGSGVIVNVNRPAFSAQNGTSPQTYSLNTLTQVQLSVELFDTDSAYDASTYKFTVPTGQAGKYMVSIDGAFENTADYSEAWLVLYKNGSQDTSVEARIRMAGDTLDGGASQRLSASGVLDLSVSDYLEVYGKLNAGSGTPQFNQDTMHFSAYKLGV